MQLIHHEKCSYKYINSLLSTYANVHKNTTQKKKKKLSTNFIKYVPTLGTYTKIVPLHLTHIVIRVGVCISATWK